MPGSVGNGGNSGKASKSGSAGKSGKSGRWGAALAGGASARPCTSRARLLPAPRAQYGGAVFQTQPLSGEQWALCIGIGALSLLVHEAARCIPSEDQ